MAMKLLVATRNPGKLKEFRELLAGAPVELVSLAELGLDTRVEETGQSYAENALLKARAACQLAGLCALADDSGLEVDVLGGQPGIRSARFGGPGRDDGERVDLLLSKMQDVPWEQRTARFRAAIAIVCPDGRSWVVDGHCDGIISLQPFGRKGFGYDPVFFLPRFGATMAELSEEQKNAISHRAMAARQARSILLEELGGAQR